VFRLRPALTALDRILAALILESAFLETVALTTEDMTSAWWTRRSTSAATATGSPKISTREERVLFELTMRDERMDLPNSRKR
jgi:hypothetical protein